MKFKTLVRGHGDYQEFLVYSDYLKEWGTSSTPHLYPETFTIEGLKALHPNPDFGDGRVVTIEIKIIEE